MAEDSGRRRFTGQLEQVVAIVAQAATSVCFLPYDDNFAKARVLPALISRNKDMLNRLHVIMPTFCFTKPQCKQIFGEVVAGKAWDMTEAVRLDWVDTVAERFRAQSKHLRDAFKKNPKTKWLQVFDWVTGEEPEAKVHQDASDEEGGESEKQDDVDDEVEASAVDEADDFGFVDNVLEKEPENQVRKRPAASTGFDKGASGNKETCATLQVKCEKLGEQKPAFWYGWSSEHRKAFRLAAGTTVPDFADKVYVPEGSLGHHLAMAQWEDGEHPISDLTCDEWRAMEDVDKLARTTVASSAVHFTGTHSTSGNCIVVKDRQDRGELVSLFDGIQCKSDALENKDDVVKMMIGIAEAFAKDQLQKVELKKNRDDILATFRKEVKKADAEFIRKRPAAAASSVAASSAVPVGPKRAKSFASTTEQSPGVDQGGGFLAMEDLPPAEFLSDMF